VIRIKRPVAVPEVLRTRGTRNRDRVCARVEAHQNGFNPAGKITFNQNVYGHVTVKEAISQAQHMKCCYCESVVGNAGDVEHFRPKGGVCQRKGAPAQTPGYYWLAYAWTNLLLACKPCNQLYKQNYFPLANPRQRACDPGDDLSRERVLLIDPADTDPTAYISFRREIPYAVRGNRIGRTTIEVLQLHQREDLNERRRARLEFLAEMRSVIELAGADPGNARLRAAAARADRILQRALTDAGEFSAMARAAHTAGLLG